MEISRILALFAQEGVAELIAFVSLVSSIFGGMVVYFWPRKTKIDAKSLQETLDNNDIKIDGGTY